MTLSGSTTTAADMHWPSRPLDVMASCRARDLPILEIVAEWLPRNVPLKDFYVVSPDHECKVIRNRLGKRAQVLPEDGFIPGVTLADICDLPVEGFPRSAGWYFQQLLKLQFAFSNREDDYYLIWDADTVPLRPMRFFDEAGHMLLTQATEYHAPYFETYRRLFGEDAHREFSFIAQHLIVQKSVAREMFERIESHVPGGGNWALKIMRSLPPYGRNLFSEYETYGHFVKNHYPERIRFIERTWHRPAPTVGGCKVPTREELERAAEQYEYAAYERASRGWQRLARIAFATWQKWRKPV